ncbi:hypothetical protein [Viridibacterium curvum]|uniref:Lipoprotein n=1 Tax=Viridibacterium curvum TaxID=1101404 RepID=A0ABP9QAF7_9RHOO
MKIFNKNVTRTIGLLAAALLMQACSGPLTLVAPTPPMKYEKLGRVEGTACGVILGPLIPITLNGRVGEAQRLALEKAPGASSLINVDIKEEWAWFGIGISRCTTISGDAIKEVK